MKLDARTIILLCILVIAISITLSFLWEFIMEPLAFPDEDSHELKMKFFIHNIVFAALALPIPAAIAIHIQKRHNQIERRAAQDRHQAEQTHSRFEDFAETASDWFWETDPEGRFSFVSDNFFADNDVDPSLIIGRTREEFSRNRSSVLGDTTWEDHFEDLRKHKEFRNFCYKVSNNKGGFRCVSTSGKPIYSEDGTFMGYRGTSRDITQEQEAKETLLASEQRFRDFTESASDWLWETGPDLRFTNVTRRFFEMTGIEPKEIIGKTRWEFANLHSSDQSDPIWKQHRSDMEGHVPFRDFTYKTIGPDGEDLYISISGKPIFNDSGAFLGYRGTGRNVTEVQEIRNDLIRAKEEAEHANMAKSDFLASMSHELRTPMNAIIGFSEMILHNASDPPSEKDKEYLSYILSSANHLMGLINQVLELSRIESGEINIHPEPVSFKKTVEDTTILLQGSAAKKNIEIIASCGCHDDITVWADPLRLKQVLFNIVSNAIKYNKDNGTVSISCGEDTGDTVKIFVSDTGIGIPESKLKDLFQPFNRLGLEARNIEGTGIGLTITKDLVERMDGQIGFESTEGQGTTFWIVLPKIDVQPAKFAEQGAT